MSAVKPLPPLDGFSRAELEDLVGILHRALVRAQSDYETLSATTERAIGMLRAISEPAK